MAASTPSGRRPTQSGGTAKILILVGLVLQLLSVLGFAAFSLVATRFAGKFSIILLPLAAIGVIWIIMVFLYGYLRTARAEYTEALTPVLIIAILSLVTLSVLSAIFYFIGWAKLGDAVREQDEFSRQQSAVAGPPPVQFWQPPPPSPPPAH